MLSFLEGQGIEGATVLEIGGGVGEVQIELLKRGAARTVNFELSPAYDEDAMQLVREAGVEGRAERRLHDIAADPGGVEPADVVVLHRVVCCYPDYERLLGAAADHARRLLVFTYPPRNVASRLLLGGENLLQKFGEDSSGRSSTPVPDARGRRGPGPAPDIHAPAVGMADRRLRTRRVGPRRVETRGDRVRLLPPELQLRRCGDSGGRDRTGPRHLAPR